jgi:hypothetical protein
MQRQTSSTIVYLSDIYPALCRRQLGLGRMGNQSFDAKADSITNMLDFDSSTGHHAEKLFLSPATGMQNTTAPKR